jgi:acylphosphatase
METAAHMVVKGLVQGVGFRYFVLREASKLGLKGYVRNLNSGDVEVHAEGDRSLVEELIAAIKVGPRSAHVTDVRLEWRPPDHTFHGFDVR